MIKMYRTLGEFVEIPNVEKGCWINAIQPTPDEIRRLTNEFQLPEDAISDILDADERPRFEYDDTWSLIIMRIPIANANNGVPYITVPLGIFLAEKFTITLCSVNNEVLPLYQNVPLRDQYNQLKDPTNFVLRLFLRSGSAYLRYLKVINQMTTSIEKDLEKSIKNKELNKLLKLEKSLVYCVTSIKSNETVLARLKNYKQFGNKTDEDLLEDAMIESRQALEMAQIYSDILSGMMDAFASIISNNLNVIMKKLTLISILLMVPTLISSIFGMNVTNFMEDVWWAMPSIVMFSLTASFIGILMFKKRQWF